MAGSIRGWKPTPAVGFGPVWVLTATLTGIAGGQPFYPLDRTQTRPRGGHLGTQAPPAVLVKQEEKECCPCST